MSDNEYERRMKMFAAIDTGDDQSLSVLIKEDTFLESYHYVIRWAAGHSGGDPVLLQKLLDHPALDQTTQAYKRVVADEYSSMGANNENPSPEILKLLLEKFKDDQPLKEQSLSFIFSTVAVNDPNWRSSPEAARLLINSGASLKKAFSAEADGLEAQRQAFDRKLGALREFKAKVAGP